MSGKRSLTGNDSSQRGLLVRRRSWGAGIKLDVGERRSLGEFRRLCTAQHARAYAACRAGVLLSGSQGQTASPACWGSGSCDAIPRYCPTGLAVMAGTGVGAQRTLLELHALRTDPGSGMLHHRRKVHFGRFPPRNLLCFMIVGQPGVAHEIVESSSQM